MKNTSFGQNALVAITCVRTADTWRAAVATRVAGTASRGFGPGPVAVAVPHIHRARSPVHRRPIQTFPVKPNSTGTIR